MTSDLEWADIEQNVKNVKTGTNLGHYKYAQIRQRKALQNNHSSIDHQHKSVTFEIILNSLFLLINSNRVKIEG